MNSVNKMKIIGVSAGRKNSNCQALCSEALNAAQAKGAEVELIHLPSLNIENCRGCFYCSRTLSEKGISQCVIRDDFDWLRDKLLDADGIIFSMPVFRLGAPATFFRLMERFGVRDDLGFYIRANREGHPLNDERILRKRPVAYIGVGGTDYVINFRSDCMLFSAMTLWPTVDIAVFGWTKSVFCQEEKLQRSHDLGERIADEVIRGEPFRQIKGFCPRCGSDSIVILSDNDVECSSCRCRGSLYINQGVVQFVPLPKEKNFCYSTEKGKIMHTLDVEENNRVRNGMQQLEQFKNRKKYYEQLYKISAPKQ